MQGPQPVLVLLDRFNDIYTMVAHSWNYLGQIQDFFGPIKNNTVQFQESPQAPM